MKKSSLLLISVFSFLAVSAQNNAPDCKDSPLFTRMPNTSIGDCSSSFDEVEIALGEDKKETKEGTRTMIQYNYEADEATAPSFFQIVKNFENAIVKNGGKRMYYGKDQGVASFYTKTGGKEAWVVLNDFGGVKKGNFELIILEIAEMKQDITAGEMLEAINKNGSVALQINFETSKSVIKPESQGIIDQIAAMLTSDQSLKVSIEGHTDNVGNPAANKSLSEERARSVINALSAKGVDKTRLSAKGWGQEKPVADNSTEAGKAKNRRVEIVKK